MDDTADLDMSGLMSLQPPRRKCVPVSQCTALKGCGKATDTNPVGINVDTKYINASFLANKPIGKNFMNWIWTYVPLDLRMDVHGVFVQNLLHLQVKMSDWMVRLKAHGLNYEVRRVKWHLKSIKSISQT